MISMKGQVTIKKKQVFPFSVHTKEFSLTDLECKNISHINKMKKMKKTEQGEELR